MYAVSDRWDKAIRGSGTMVCRVEVWRRGVFTGTTLTATGGSVRVDDSSKVRRTLSLSTSDVALMPDDASDLLNVVDTDLKVFAGVTYTEGDTELIPVFTGRIQEPSRPGWFTDLQISAVDYAKVLDESRFPRPWNVTTASNSRAFTVLSAMVRDVLPWVEVINLTGKNPRIGGHSWDKSRTEAIDDLAWHCGGTWWFTPDGDMIVGTTERSLAGDPDWVIDAGTATSVLTGSGQSMNADRIYNAVTATSAPQDGSPISQTIYLMTGPLRYRDGFQRPRFWKTNLPMTQAELGAVANNLLRKKLQLVTRVPASCAPNPALEVGDLVQVAIPDGSRVLRLVNGFTIPLTAADVGGDGMSLELVTPTDLDETQADIEVSS